MNCRQRWPRILALLLTVGLLLAAPAKAQEQRDDKRAENQIKAAFLYKFTGYVEWPEGAFPSADAPLRIGVIGADALAAELEQVIDGRKVNERSVVVRRLKPDEAVKGVQILFIGQGALLRPPPMRGLLVVTESEGALTHGSIVNFVLTERRVRFEIALDSAEKRGLRLSSRLLAVAQKVVTEAP